MAGILNVVVWNHEIGEIRTKQNAQTPSVLAGFEPALYTALPLRCSKTAVRKMLCFHSRLLAHFNCSTQ
jgi:hypothetical protein